MRNLLLAIWLFLVALACGPSARQPVAPTLSPELGRSATVALVNGKAAYCAGVWVNETDVVTAAHCVDDTKPGDLIDYALYSDIKRPEYEVSESHKIEVVRYDVDTDVALLRTAHPPHAHERAVVAGGATDGELVGVVGHPIGLIYTWMPGSVSRTIKTFGLHGQQMIVQITVPAWYGNSGGAAFNQRGEVVGIASYIGKVPGQTFFIHPNHIRDLLGRVK